MPYMYIPKSVMNEIEEFKKKKNIKKKSTAMKEFTNYANIGIKVENMYRGMTFDLFPVKRKRKKR